MDVVEADADCAERWTVDIDKAGSPLPSGVFGAS